jgi:hypothetical protein
VSAPPQGSHEGLISCQRGAVSFCSEVEWGLRLRGNLRLRSEPCWPGPFPRRVGKRLLGVNRLMRFKHISGDGSLCVGDTQRVSFFGLLSCAANSRKHLGFVAWSAAIPAGRVMMVAAGVPYVQVARGLPRPIGGWPE